MGDPFPRNGSPSCRRFRRPTAECDPPGLDVDERRWHLHRPGDIAPGSEIFAIAPQDTFFRGWGNAPTATTHCTRDPIPCTTNAIRVFPGSTGSIPSQEAENKVVAGRGDHPEVGGLADRVDSESRLLGSPMSGVLGIGNRCGTVG